jgi:hypothetical protein
MNIRFSEVSGNVILNVEGREVFLTLKEALLIRYFLNDNKEKLQPSKDWDNCPYEGHADDCDCRGMGGDR